MKLSIVCDPNNAKNLYKKGKLEKELKNWESALDSMRKAKSLDITLTIDADIKLICDELKKQNNRTYYEVMGLPNTATPEDIKKAYKKLVREFHPDRHSGNPEEQEKAEKIFKDINEANETLSDPKKKARYDQNGCRKVEDHGDHEFGNFGMDQSDLINLLFGQSGFSNFGQSKNGAGGAGAAARSRSSSSSQACVSSTNLCIGQ